MRSQITPTKDNYQRALLSVLEKRHIMKPVISGVQMGRDLLKSFHEVSQMDSSQGYDYAMILSFEQMISQAQKNLKPKEEEVPMRELFADGSSVSLEPEPTVVFESREPKKPEGPKPIGKEFKDWLEEFKKEEEEEANKEESTKEAMINAIKFYLGMEELEADDLRDQEPLFEEMDTYPAMEVIETILLHRDQKNYLLTVPEKELATRFLRSLADEYYDLEIDDIIAISIEMVFEDLENSTIED